MRDWLVRNAVAVVAASVLVAGVVLAGYLRDADAAGNRDAVPPGSVVFVVGGHAEAPTGPLTGTGAWARDLAGVQGSSYAVVVADGSPYVAAHGTLEVGAGENDDRRVEDAVEAATARSPQTDLLAALTVAGTQLSTDGGLRTVVVRDPGLSTAGVLNFTTPGLLDADPREIADSLADYGQLPDLRGALVVFQGIGETAAPQTELAPVHEVQLRAIWEAVAKRAGAVDVTFEPLSGSRPPAADLPPVATVALDVPLSCAGRTLTVFGSGMAFLPGSHDFIDPDAAEDLLRPVATRMIGDRQLVAEVFGHYAAVGDGDRRTELSEERAQAVANVLINLGVSVNQLRVKGFGSDFPGYLPDRDASGHLDPARAALNRTVVVDFSRNGQDAPCA